MYDVKVYQIVNYLLSTSDYVTSSEIGEAISFSSKTVLNHFPQVESLLEEHNLSLEKVRGRGCKLVGDYEAKSKLLISLSKVHMNSNALSVLERKLYILDMLLNQQRSITISELEELLYISRPSLYKDIDGIEDWLNERDIQLIRSRKNGIHIKCGEKRLRIAIADWYNETKHYISSIKLGDDKVCKYLDPLKLNEALNQYKKFIPQKSIDNIVNEIEDIFNVKFVKKEFSRLCVILHIALPRFTQGHEVSMRSVIKNQLSTPEYQLNINKMTDIIYKHTSVKISENEKYYLFGILSMAQTHDNQHYLRVNNIYKNINHSIVEKVALEVYSYFKIADKLNFETELERHLGNVINRFSLAADFTNPLDEKVESQYPQIYSIAKTVVPIIKSYYNYTLPKGEISYLTLHIATAIEKSKKPLCACFIYNCSYSEARLFVETIKNYISEMYIQNYIPYPISNKVVLTNDVDLVITNASSDLECNIKTLYIPTLPQSSDIIDLHKSVMQIYNDINMQKIQIKPINTGGTKNETY